MENIEAAWLDIDNTLVYGDEMPSEKIKTVLTKIPRFGINTQRSVGMAEKVIDPREIKTSLPSIILSGGEIWELGNKMIKAFPLAPEVRTKIADLVSLRDDIAIVRFYPKGDRHIYFYVGNQALEDKFSVLYRSTNSFGQMTRDIKEFAGWLKNTETSMVTIRTFEKTNIDFPQALSEAIEIDPSSKSDYVITRKGVRKATSFLWLCNYLHIDPSKVLTAGDNPAVDSEVFQHTFGISVAPELLPNAKINVKTIDELADLLDKIFSKK